MRGPLPAVERVDETVHSFAHGKIKHLAVESCVVPRSASKANHLPIGQIVFSRAARRKNYLGREDVDDVQSHLGIRDLRLSAAKKTEQLSITDILATKFGNVTRNDEIRAAN